MSSIEKPSFDDLPDRLIRARIRKRLFHVESVEAEPEEPRRFSFIREIGTGGSGRVYTARDAKLDRTVAVKVIDAERGSIEEARRLAKLRHPNVVTVHDVEEDGGKIYIYMEYVPGLTLRQWLDRSPPLSQVLEVFAQAARGLQAAHEIGLTHRDFKPDNVLVGSDERVRILDFGVALERAAEVERSAGVGTPQYMSPEQYLATGVDASSDQYSFCVALFEALYGRMPSVAKSSASSASSASLPTISPAALVLDDVHRIDVPFARKIPRRVRRLLVRGLSFRPAERYATMQALLEDLIPRRRGWPYVVGALAVGGVITASLLPAPVLPPCDDPSEALTAVWSDSSRAELASAFSRVGVPYAEQTLETARDGLDRYGDGWRSSVEEVCAAHRDGSLADEDFHARVACLNERRLRLVDSFKNAERDTVMYAVPAVEKLGALEACMGTSHRLASSSAEVAEVDKKTRELRTLEHTGNIKAARQKIDGLVAQARAAKDKPALARALFAAGSAAASDGQYARAGDLLSEAANLAEAVGDDWLAVDVLNRLTKLAALKLGDATRGELWLERAAAKVERIEDKGLRLGALHENRALLATMTGKFDVAVEQHQLALGLRSAALGERSLEVADTLLNLGNAYADKGEPERALELYASASEVFGALLGPEHPYLVDPEFNRATVEYERGDYQDAKRRAEQILKIERERYGPRSQWVAEDLLFIASIDERIAAYEDGLTHAREALAILETIEGTRGSRARAHDAIGVMETQLKRPDEALLHHRKALELWREGDDGDAIERALCWHKIGWAHEAKGEPAKALEAYDTGLRVLNKANVPADNPDRAYFLRDKGELLRELGERDTAIALLEQARSLWSAGRQETAGLMLTHWHLAKALAHEGTRDERARALELARAALEYYRSLGARGDTMTEKIQAWISRNE